MAALLCACLTLTACEQPEIPNFAAELESVDVVDFANLRAFSVDGIAIEQETGDRHIFLGGQGVLVIDRDGQTVNAVPLAAAEVLASGLTDLSLMPGNRYALLNWERLTMVDRQSMESEESVSTSKSQAGMQDGWESTDGLTWDDEREVLLAGRTTAYWDAVGNQQVTTEIVSYSPAGEEVQSTNIDLEEVWPRGLARHPSEPILILAEADQLYTFDLDGNALARGSMPEVQGASGLAIDEEEGLLWVTDNQDLEMRAYPLATLVPSFF